MASSSVSQEDLENDFERNSRRSRVRSARARNVNAPVLRIADPGDHHHHDDGGCADGFGGGHCPDHDASPKPQTRAKDKRLNRINHVNKGKAQRERRKLREKRRSTGVVHLPSTESTGGSTGEDEPDTETRRNTLHNESAVGGDPAPEEMPKKTQVRRTKSPSDLDADDEDNQDYDSLHQSDSTVSLVQQPNGRPATPTSDNLEDMLDSAQVENRRLLRLLEERDRKITSLEEERDRLKEENTALIRALATK